MLKFLADRLGDKKLKKSRCSPYLASRTKSLLALLDRYRELRLSPIRCLVEFCRLDAHLGLARLLLDCSLQLHLQSNNVQEPEQSI